MSIPGAPESETLLPSCPPDAVLQALLAREQRAIRLNAFYQLDQADEVSTPGDLRFIVVDPANPHKNVADNFKDTAVLLEYAAATLRDFKTSMASGHAAAGMQQPSRSAAGPPRQRRVIALLASLMRMNPSVEQILKLPYLDKITTRQLAPVLTIGPFTFQFVAFIQSVEQKNQYPPVAPRWLWSADRELRTPQMTFNVATPQMTSQATPPRRWHASCTTTHRLIRETNYASSDDGRARLRMYNLFAVTSSAAAFPVPARLS